MIKLWILDAGVNRLQPLKEDINSLLSCPQPFVLGYTPSPTMRGIKLTKLLCTQACALYRYPPALTQQLHQSVSDPHTHHSSPVNDSKEAYS